MPLICLFLFLCPVLVYPGAVGGRAILRLTLQALTNQKVDNFVHYYHVCASVHRKTGFLFCFYVFVCGFLFCFGELFLTSTLTYTYFTVHSFQVGHSPTTMLD